MMWKIIKSLRVPTKWSFPAKLNVFFVTNIIFMSVGIASLAVGVWLYIDRNVFIELTPSSYSALSAVGLCCFTGATVSIISIVGLAGAWMHNKCLLLTFICFGSLLFIVQSLTGIVGLFQTEGASQRVRLDLLRNINKTHVMTKSGQTIDLGISWNQLQQSLKCCGVDGPADWYNSQRWPKNTFVPDSCCDPLLFEDKDSMEHCGKVPLTDSHWYKQGCYSVFVDWLFYHIWVVNWLSFILLISEFLVVPPAILLLLEIRKFHTKSGRRRETEVRRRLVEINERERRDLQLNPLDRIGDASANSEHPVGMDQNSSNPN